MRFYGWSAVSAVAFGVMWELLDQKVGGFVEVAPMLGLFIVGVLCYSRALYHRYNED